MAYVKWLTRGGKVRWQPRADDSSVFRYHYRRETVLMTGGRSGGSSIWEHPTTKHEALPPDGCYPILYRWRWRARLRAWFHNRSLANNPQSYRLDGVWHER